MLKAFCDLCGRDPAINLDRIPVVLDSGHRVLVSVRLEVDEGEREARKADICRGCLVKAAKAFVRIN